MEETASREASDERFRRVLGQYPTGVCVVTGIAADGQPTGLAVGSFTSLSLHPPLVAFMPDKTSSSWPKIRPANAFCVNILSAGQESVCRVFATKAEQAHEVRFIYVPVFGVDGTAPISLGVRLTHPLDSLEQLKCYVRHMQEVSGRVTESIGGRIPPREKIQ